MNKRTKVLHVGTSTRAHILAESLSHGRLGFENHLICEVDNPGLRAVAASIAVGPCDDVEFVARVAAEVKPDFCLPGSEAPLAVGVVDRLLAMGVPSVGPERALAQLEASKAFTRRLLTDFAIPGNPDYRVFEDEAGVLSYLRELGAFVVKPDGLTGGKGVKVSGDHLASAEEGLAYCLELFAAGGTVVVEERLLGEEFSLQSFCDGQTLADMPPAQDHKRLGVGDTGPNTGGMGSYSCEDHLLPFLGREDLRRASEINRAVAAALREKTGRPYKGVLYGNFMLTAAGIRLVEYNARFGDPEVMNVLAILETDFGDICQAIIEGGLGGLAVTFARRATVCKYVVPQGYPRNPVRGERIGLPTIDNRGEDERMYYGAVTGTAEDLRLTGSRAMAFVGIGDSLAQAEERAEAGAAAVTGPVFHRSDIGGAELVARRVEHMRQLRQARSTGAVRQSA
ncbi:MAG: phosphoribosylamine--glycine ligase [Caulobacteraceae bacterium]